MKIDEIRKQWVRKPYNNTKNNADVWDCAADGFKKKSVTDAETNGFLSYLKQKVELTKEMKALDVGCGTGIYSLALAKQIDHVVGMDVSPKMIAYAKENAKENDISNAEFINVDWSVYDIERYKKRFDIVFAHMTPAVSDAHTFEKMIDCSKTHCFMVKPTRRTDSVLDEVKKIAHIDTKKEIGDESIVYSFNLLWELGYSPEFTYEKEIWDSEKDVDEAVVWYQGRAKTMADLSQETLRKIEDYVRSQAVDGKVRGIIKTTKVTMYWRVDQ